MLVSTIFLFLLLWLLFLQYIYVFFSFYDRSDYEYASGSEEAAPVVAPRPQPIKNKKKATLLSSAVPASKASKRKITIHPVADAQALETSSLPR